MLDDKFFTKIEHGIIAALFILSLVSVFAALIQGAGIVFTAIISLISWIVYEESKKEQHAER